MVASSFLIEVCSAQYESHISVDGNACKLGTSKSKRSMVTFALQEPFPSKYFMSEAVLVIVLGV
jgi:hypothetical protein